MISNHTKMAFVNTFIDDGRLNNCFESVRTVRNKVWSTKHAKRQAFTKRTMDAKKAIRAIFSSSLIEFSQKG